MCIFNCIQITRAATDWFNHSLCLILLLHVILYIFYFPDITNVVFFLFQEKRSVLGTCVYGVMRRGVRFTQQKQYRVTWQTKVTVNSSQTATLLWSSQTSTTSGNKVTNWWPVSLFNVSPWTRLCCVSLFLVRMFLCVLPTGAATPTGKRERILK